MLLCSACVTLVVLSLVVRVCVPVCVCVSLSLSLRVRVPDLPLSLSPYESRNRNEEGDGKQSTIGCSKQSERICKVAIYLFATDRIIPRRTGDRFRQEWAVARARGVQAATTSPVHIRLELPMQNPLTRPVWYLYTATQVLLEWLGDPP